ncbi:(E)-4-hydroxy-3-methylbut-2-enyl-diphosphate synthase [uncultured Cytophaga sp.]|uniref:(E)-4-hydroxy-3-methylbut-2-enyl-diphosphate synthase n=1 Tax=uncultured Cytophaga sp. TaxID=160238 RepID=UPI0026244E62|nr:(E)-4-hydroxy-3-methylbut-2-enyl-diphosphate synthase [uncultured Cytophaga sp.]
MSANEHSSINSKYCSSLTQYIRRKSSVVTIGKIPMGGDNPIRLQSMTTVDTMDTLGSVEQIIRMVDAGCEYVRVTAPSVKEAQNLAEIKKELLKRGYDVPLVADIHFTPNAAELAAKIVEKVRINPGNYADKKKFEVIEYTDASYQEELVRIREKFVPLVTICKEYGTAMRIGTNHGSLSDRILSRYGDTPLGMVESALEFLRICEDLEYYNIVISMKASNTQVMVQAYRLLVQKLEEEGLRPYPLHLGVTEAGEAEDGRIKSAVGIGSLLEDGLGDTVRVSLTEAPEFEIPVAAKLVDRYVGRSKHTPIPFVEKNPINPFSYKRRKTLDVHTIGATNVPRVIADYSLIENLEVQDLKPIGHFYLPALDKWSMNDLGADFIYTGHNKAPFMMPNGLKEIVDADTWKVLDDQTHVYPLFAARWYKTDVVKHPQLNFVLADIEDIDEKLLLKMEADASVVLILESFNEHAMAELRRSFITLMNRELKTPVIIKRAYAHKNEESLILAASTDVGGLLIDGLGDGIYLSTNKLISENKMSLLANLKNLNNIAFGILQAARTRMTKTEYISCPSCGRTLFDLQETTAMIRKRTDHLKGVKIGIMGCIVNGPGEMADADYGYVGVGKDKIALYRGQTVVKKAVSSDKAVDELINIIKEDGKWLEPIVSEYI